MPRDEETEDTEELESDDTSEEEDTEEEDSEDTEEETTEEEDSEESESEEDEATEEKSESKSKQYIDLKKVPAELQEAAKRMISSHTKAMQRVADVVSQKVTEAEQALQVKYSSAIIKASGFDKITNLVGWDEFWEDAQNGKPYGYSSSFRKNSKVVDTDDDDDSASANGNKKLTADSIAKAIMPQVQRLINSAIAPIQEEKSRNLWADAEKNLPNFSKHRAAITAMLSKHPTLSLSEAYDLVAGDDKVSSKVEEELKKAHEKAKKIPKKTLRSGGSSSDKPLTKETVKSIDDALSHARKDILRR